jgi:hypothetical protein
VAAAASWLRGGKYVHGQTPLLDEIEGGWIDETDVGIPVVDTASTSRWTKESSRAADRSARAACPRTYGKRAERKDQFHPGRGKDDPGE